MTPPRLGVVCGLRSEARALGRLTRDRGSANLFRLTNDPGVLVWTSGADTRRAHDGARALAAEGVGALVSFGLAGGLDAALRPGDALRPAFVVDAATGDSLPVAAPRSGAPIERLVQANEIVATVDAKAALRKRTGAAAVDMESFAVASVAFERGLAIHVLRAIGDPYDRALPKAALTATRSDGGLALGRTLAAIARRPADLPALLALGRDADRGMAALRRFAKDALFQNKSAQSDSD